jgi:hypothetical protein
MVVAAPAFWALNAKTWVPFWMAKAAIAARRGYTTLAEEWNFAVFVISLSATAVCSRCPEPYSTDEYDDDDEEWA